MTDDRNEGRLTEAKGKIKEGIGGATDNEQMEREGEADQLKGNVQQGVGDIKESLGDRDRDR